MNDPLEPPPLPDGESEVAQGRKVVFGVVGLSVVLFAGMAAAIFFNPDTRHREVLRRLRAFVETAGSSPAEGPEARGIWEVKRAIATASGNSPLWYRSNAPTAQLREVVEHLERTKGADFQTYAGALEVLARLEALSPTLHDYAWMVSLREMQDDGTIPKPPPKR